MDLLHYQLIFGELTSTSKGERTFSRLIGKKLIPPMAKEQSGIWPFERGKAYVDFIVGTDKEGEPVLHSCNPDKLSNYFTTLPGAPHYLTPVFFRRAVLAKYFEKPSRYEVSDGRLTCARLWSVQIDTELPDRVAVFLGDLGRDLPGEEQAYWKTFNVVPDGTISETNLRRSILGQFAAPQHPELAFKSNYQRIRKKWSDRFGWDLFKPLATDDAHLFATLRVPLHEEQKEFDEQSLALTKLLIDSLNERELEQRIPPQPADTKGISKLQVYLEIAKMPNALQHVKFLRSLQALRQGAAHRKGKDYRSAATAFGIGIKSLRGAFETVFITASEFLLALERRFLTEDSP